MFMKKKETYNYYDEFIKNSEYIVKSATILKESLKNYNQESLGKNIVEVHKLENEAEIQISGNIYEAAASDSNSKAILLSNYNSAEEKTIIEVKNLCGRYNAGVFYCTEDKHLAKEFSFDVFNETKIEISVKEHTVALIKLEKK